MNPKRKTTNKYIIVTHYNPPPIPTRFHDWSAIDDNTYGGEECDPIGWGETEFDAIRALIDRIEERMTDV